MRDFNAEKDIRYIQKDRDRASGSVRGSDHELDCESDCESDHESDRESDSHQGAGDGSPKMVALSR